MLAKTCSAFASARAIAKKRLKIYFPIRHDCLIFNAEGVLSQSPGFGVLIRTLDFGGLVREFLTPKGLPQKRAPGGLNAMKPLRGKSSGFGHPGFDGYIEPWALVCNAFSVERYRSRKSGSYFSNLAKLRLVYRFVHTGLRRTHQPGRQELRNVVRGGRHAQTHRVDQFINTRANPQATPAAKQSPQPIGLTIGVTIGGVNSATLGPAP